MAECTSAVDHCLVGAESGVFGAEQSVCCNAAGPAPHFSDLYRFSPTDTGNHQCCLVAVINTTGHSCGADQDDGKYCGYGCEMCDDHYLDDMADYLDGERWLRAEQRLGQRYWDAQGQLHDLRSNEYHPIPGKVVYERGSCWGNGGRECFQEDACACFGINSPLYPGLDSSIRTALHAWDCAPGGDHGDVIPDSELLPDTFFRTGYRWPPTTMAGSAGRNSQPMGHLYCRAFPDGRLPFSEGGGHDVTRVLVEPTKSGGLPGITEPMLDPAILSSNTCSSDRLIHCAGRMGTQSWCATSAYDEFHENYPHVDAGHAFYNDHEPSRNRFNKLAIDMNDGDDAVRIRGASTGEGLAGPTAKWKTDVLQAIAAGEFRTAREHVEPEEEATESITFNRLDHQHPLQGGGNALLGVYRREWGGPNIIPMPVPNGTGTGRLRMSGCEFDYATVLTHVRIECRLILPQVKQWAGDYYIEPLARFHIIAVASMRVGNLRSAVTDRGVAGPCSVESWQSRGQVGGRDFEQVFLDVFNRPVEHGTVPELWASVQPPREPEGDPRLELPMGTPWDQAESFMFFNDEGEQFIPDRLVEWRGMLGEHSVPKARYRRIWLGEAGGDCGLVAERFNTWVIGHTGIPVPGWPTHVDSNPNDPQQVYGGAVKLKLVE